MYPVHKYNGVRSQNVAATFLYSTTPVNTPYVQLYASFVVLIILLLASNIINIIGFIIQNKDLPIASITISKAGLGKEIQIVGCIS
jgi:hypothetical protein